MDNSYKTIIPGLVSLDTKLNSLNGFVMCQNFNFYPETKTKSKYHYTLIQDSKISVPSNYDFRSEYYVKKGNCWYFSRKISFWKPTFKYDSKKKTLSFNNDYFLLPLKVGGVFTLGEHLSNMIDLDLFLDGYVCLRGIAYQKNSQNICISAPGFNGKTSLLKKTLKMGASYIAEDYLVIDLKKFIVFPTCPLAAENFWRRRGVNRELSGLVTDQKTIKTSVKIDKLLLMENSQNNKFKTPKRSPLDCLLLNSLYFLNNLFIKSYIYDKGYTHKLFENITTAETKLSRSSFVAVHDYHYSLP